LSPKGVVVMAFGITKKCKLCGQIGELRCGYLEGDNKEELCKVVCRNLNYTNETPLFQEEESAVREWEASN
jgi:hypothetical protein